MINKKIEGNNKIKATFCEQRKQVFCKYKNATSNPQIVRIADTHYFFEKVVYPEQEIVFQAFLNSFLEIYTSEMITAILADKILCLYLRIKS